MLTSDMRGRTTRGALLVLLVVSLLPTIASPTAASEGGRKPRAVAGAVRLVPLSDGPVMVEGLHAYFGVIELRPDGDGVTVVNRLPLEDYLLGLNEVPLTWPREALRAQAVAARTYALWTLGQPRSGEAAVRGFDICASTDCQVFAGADVLTSNLAGFRWSEAVASTKGQTILYDGAPILARYHSTSGGQTLDNEQAFPEEGPYPYLKGVPSATEQAAPLYRWEVSFRLRDLEAMLRRAGRWPQNMGRLLAARTFPSRSGLHYPDIVFKARRGRLRLTAEDFRIIVRELAPQMFPGRYPAPGPTASGRLPETLPSNRITGSSNTGVMRIVGRGWGHGVGMSQWGAQGQAAVGASYEQILAHYYRGTGLGETPARKIEVGVGWGLPSVAVTGAFRVEDRSGKPLVRQAYGTWTFGAGPDGTLMLRGPGASDVALSLGIVRAPDVAQAEEAAKVQIVLSKPASVRLATAPTSDASTHTRFGPGPRTLRFAAPSEPGRYQVELRAAAGEETTNASFILTVAGPAGEVEDAPATDREPPGQGPSVLVLGLGLVFLALLILAVAVTMTG